MNSEGCSGEIGRIRAEYRRKDSSAAYGSQFRAFQPTELGYRLQQAKCLGELMRQAGYTDLSGLRILDFGCGTGRLTGDLIGLGAEPSLLCGVDLMESRLEAARKKYPQVGFEAIDGETMPFAGETFDLAIQSVVFSSIALPELRAKAAEEILRVLKLGGFIYWWDLFRTVEEAGSQTLDPGDLFPGLPIVIKQVSWLPKPSEGLAKRRWRYSLGWIIDLFAAKPTHLVALIGPRLH